MPILRNLSSRKTPAAPIRAIERALGTVMLIAATNIIVL